MAEEPWQDMDSRDIAMAGQPCQENSQWTARIGEPKNDNPDIAATE